jgi:hypothetical protein
LKKAFALIIVLFLIYSCQKETEKVEIKVEKPKFKKVEFGFNYADYNVVQDTVKRGDSFGSIIQRQNIGERKVHDIVEQVKDSFNLKNIRYNKPYTVLRSKTKKNDLEVFIYQPDALTYYVIDFRDSIVKAHKKVKPVTLCLKL